MVNKKNLWLLLVTWNWKSLKILQKENCNALWNEKSQIPGHLSSLYTFMQIFNVKFINKMICQCCPFLYRSHNVQSLPSKYYNLHSLQNKFKVNFNTFKCCTFFFFFSLAVPMYIFTVKSVRGMSLEYPLLFNIFLFSFFFLTLLLVTPTHT